VWGILSGRSSSTHLLPLLDMLKRQSRSSMENPSCIATQFESDSRKDIHYPGSLPQNLPLRLPHFHQHDRKRQGTHQPHSRRSNFEQALEVHLCRSKSCCDPPTLQTSRKFRNLHADSKKSIFHSQRTYNHVISHQIIVRKLTTLK